MKQLYKKLKKAFPFVGERGITEDDVFSFCADHGIEIVFSPHITDASYVTYDGESFIFVNHKLNGWRLLHRLCHEIGHYLFHVPTQSSFAVEMYGLEHYRKRNECEAEAVAAWLMLPMHEMENTLQSGIYKNDKEIGGLISTRINVFKYESKTKA
ncbi:MAG: ImmA/IrrE family metallo-endopeptidase [Pyrinomonadaceae bacterium]